MEKKFQLSQVTNSFDIFIIYFFLFWLITLKNSKSNNCNISIPTLVYISALINFRHGWSIFYTFSTLFDIRQGPFMFALKMSKISQSSSIFIIYTGHSASFKLYSVHALMLWLKMLNGSISILRKIQNKYNYIFLLNI